MSLSKTKSVSLQAGAHSVTVNLTCFCLFLFSFLRSIDTLSRDTTLPKLFMLHIEKGSTLKGKKIALLGSKLFPFRVDLFTEGNWCKGKQTGSHKSFLPCQKWCKIYQVYLIT